MKDYYLFLLTFVLLTFLFACNKNNDDTKSCEDGKILFDGNCIGNGNSVYYFGKSGFYCLSDSLAIGIDTIQNKVFGISADSTGIEAFGFLKLTNTFKTIHVQCETNEYGTSNTTVYFEDISELEKLKDAIHVTIYQNDWNLPFTRYDSLSLVLYRR